MPLPTLRPFNIAQPQPMNAFLAGQQARQQTQEHQWKAEDRETAAETRKFQQTAGAISTALKAQTPQMQTQIYNSLKPKDSETPTFNFQGGKMSITYPNGEKISGPMEAIKEFAEKIKEDPSWITNPEKAKHTAAWASAMGLTVDLSKTEESGKGTEAERQAKKMGKTVPQYKLWMKEEELKLKRKHGDLPENVTRQLIELGSERRGILRQVKEVESLLSNLPNKEGKFAQSKIKYLRSLKDEASVLQETMDRLTGAEPRKLKKLDDATARAIYEEAGGDIEKAREIARDRGYEIK